MVQNEGTYNSQTGEWEYETSNAEVVINGNVTADGYGVSADGNSTVTINGNIESGDAAVVAGEAAKVTVEGDLTSTEGDGIRIYNQGKYNPATGKYEDIPANAEVNVSGNVDAHVNGVYVEGNTVITIGGDVDAGHVYQNSYTNSDGSKTESEGGSGTGVYATGSSDVVVGGNVNAYGTGVSATDDAEVTVNGSITAGYEGYYKRYKPDGSIDYEHSSDNGYGISAGGSSTVTVTGGVESVSNALNVRGEATVTVDGDVSSSKGEGVVISDDNVYNPDTGKSETVSSAAEVTINGDVAAYNTGVSVTGDSTVTVSGNVNAGHVQQGSWEHADGSAGESEYGSGNGVSAYNSSEVTVEGSITACQDGVYAQDDAIVTIGGNIEAGHVGYYKESNPDTGYYYEYETVEGAGVSASGAAQVTVGGSIDSDGSGVQTKNKHRYIDGNEEIIRTDAVVTVAGDVTAHADGVYAEGESKVTIGGDVTAGYLAQNPAWDGINDTYLYDENGNKVYNSPSGTGNGVTVTGAAKVDVAGDVDAYGCGIEARAEREYSWEETVLSDDKYIVTEETTVGLKNAEINVGGDVTAHECAIWVDGSDAQINITGNVTSENNTAICVSENPLENYTATYEKNEDGEFVETGFEWEEIDNGAFHATINVGGDVSSQAETAIITSSTVTIVVDGDVTGGEGVEEQEYHDVWEEYVPTPEEQARLDEIKQLFSDIETKEEKTIGVISVEYNGDNSGALVIKGTVSSEADVVPLVVNIHTEGENPTVDMSSVLPTIEVYEMEANSDGEFFDVNISTTITRTLGDGGEATQTLTLEQNDADQAAMIEAIAAAIQYIIKVEQVENGTISLDGVTYDTERDLMLAHEGDNIAVNVNVENGYRLEKVTGGDIAEVIDNGNGTWTVVVRRGGGVTISAIISKIQNSAVGKTVTFGKADLNGDGTLEELHWMIVNVLDNKNARIALINGADELPRFEDITKDFTEDELAAVHEGTYKALEAGQVNRFFGDGMVHAAMYVDLAALNIQ